MDALISNEEIYSRCSFGKREPYLGKNGVYNILYKTVCSVNGKVYIGVHSSKKVFDRYIGCGIWGDYSDIESSYKTLGIDTLGNLVRKYGFKSFVKENLLYFDDVDSALLQEKLLVNKEWIEDVRTMNIKIGGTKPPRRVGKENGNWGNRWSKEQKERQSKLRIVRGLSAGELNGNIKPVVVIDTYTFQTMEFNSIYMAHKQMFPESKYNTVLTHLEKGVLVRKRWVILYRWFYEQNKDNIKQIVKERIRLSRYYKKIVENKIWN